MIWSIPLINIGKPTVEKQTLTDFTDKEIKQFTAAAHERLLGIAKDKDAMLKTLKVREDSPAADKAALAIYPELLRDGYNRQQLKDIKKRMLYDAKSGAIRIKNKRLFVSPDWYAACEYYFKHDENPKGLVPAHHIVCRPYMSYNKADVLRSPHLYREHFICEIIHDPEVYKWYTTDAVVCSTHDLNSRVLQLDWDGDQLNIVVDPLVVRIAERNLEKYETIPLFYDAGKAPAELLSNEAMVHGLIRAHKCSNIGEISNMLTRLWNRDEPDQYAAALITRKNNAIIDAAKTGFVVDWKDNPELTKRINKATGGEHGRMPHFFQFSKNGRSDETNGKRNRQWAKPNNSTMNRICAAFDDIGHINMNYAGIPPFNWQMLMSGPCYSTRDDIIEDFIALCKLKTSIIIMNSEDPQTDRDNQSRTAIIEEKLRLVLTRKYSSLEYCYPYVCKYLFAGDAASKSAYKQTFWKIFGDIALNNLRENLKDYKVCTNCKMKYPSWVKKHDCTKGQTGFPVCEDCGCIFEQDQETRDVRDAKKILEELKRSMLTKRQNVERRSVKNNLLLSCYRTQRRRKQRKLLAVVCTLPCIHNVG